MASDDVSSPRPASPFLVRFQFTEEVFRQSVWYHLRHRFGAWRIVTTIIGCAVLAHVIYGWWQHPEEQGVMGTVLRVAFALVFILYLQWSLWSAVRRFRKGKLWERQIEFAFSPENFILRTPPDIERVLPWPSVREIVETPEGYLLYQAANRFHWAPFSGIREGTAPATLHQLLRASGRPWRRME